MRNQLLNIKRSWLISIGYFLFFLIIFSRIRNGIGFFWDWNWPLFQEHLNSFLSNNTHSWTDQLLGQPMLYNSSYYHNWLLSLTKYLGLEPEMVLYLLLVALAAATSFSIYQTARRKLNSSVSFLLGLVAVANPAYLYKLMSGHLSYLISLPIFIFLVYFILTKYRNNLRSALTLGLVLALVGAQIQFFLFAGIFLFVWYVLNRQQLRSRYLVMAFAIAFLINLPWLSNFLVGANSVADVSNKAGDIAFGGATFSSPIRIATMVFSSATLIKYLYPIWVFGYFGLFSLVSAGLAGKKLFELNLNPRTKGILRGIGKSENTVGVAAGASGKQDVENCNTPRINNQMEFWILLICLAIYGFMGTGVYQRWDVPIVRTLYPMLRESGHFAPVIVLFMVLLLIELWSEKRWIKWSMTIYLIVFVIINIAAIYNSLPSVNYALLRDRLTPYKEFLDKDESVFRIAAYPFFGQFSVAWEENREVRGQPLKNTGIDIFTQQSNFESLSNYIPAQQLSQSVQWQLVNNYELEPLEQRNIKYLLDFSPIYESRVDKYSDPSFYNNDLRLIKNNSKFFSELIEKNPGRITQVAPGIYELTNAKPRVEVGNYRAEIKKINPSIYEVRIDDFSENSYLRFSTNYHPSWKLKVLGRIVAESTHHKDEFGQSWHLSYPEIKALYPEKGSEIDDGSLDLKLEIFYDPESYFRTFKTISTSILVIILGYLGWAYPRQKK